MGPRRGNDPASGHPRVHQPLLGRGTSPLAWDRTWPTSKAFVFLCVDSTQKSNRASPWAPLAQPTKGMEREGVVRGRWAPRPMEGKAKGKEREGEREG